MITIETISEPLKASGDHMAKAGFFFETTLKIIQTQSNPQIAIGCLGETIKAVDQLLVELNHLHTKLTENEQ